VAGEFDRPNVERRVVARTSGEVTFGARGLAALLLLFRYFSKQEQKADSESSGIVMLDDRASRVVHRARELAHEGREDQAAVAELSAVANGRRRALRRAERASRQGGMHRESRAFDRMHRLLKAAATGGALEPVSPADAQLFDTLAQFFDRKRPFDEIWTDLVAREPLLLHVEKDVRAGRYGPAYDAADYETTEVDDEQRRVRGERARLSLELMERLRKLLGPQAANADPVIRSRKARDFAYWHLDRLPRSSA
jgi:hypothetical protein